MSTPGIDLKSALIGAVCALLLAGLLVIPAQIFAQEGKRVKPKRPPAVLPGHYIGAAKCKKCHFGKFKSWHKSHHPDAFAVLPAKYRTDRSCLECHATGTGQPGGFVSEAQTPDMVGVGCEMCHGPGKSHADYMKQNEAKKKDPAIIAQGRALLGRYGGAEGARTGCYRCHLADTHKKHPAFDR